MGSSSFRLWGIDAPERAQTCTREGNTPYPCGENAKRALERLIDGKAISCMILDQDRYLRLVARCTSSSGVDLSREMIRQGWAIEYSYFSHGYYKKEQKQASLHKQGLWAGHFINPREWRKIHKNKNDERG